MKKISILIAFVIGYLLFSGGSVDSHFWFPFIIVTVITLGWGKIKLWEDGEGSKKFKKIVGLRDENVKK